VSITYLFIVPGCSCFTLSYVLALWVLLMFPVYEISELMAKS